MHVTAALELEMTLEGQALDFYNGLDPLEQADFQAACGAFLGSIVASCAKVRGDFPLSTEDVSLVRLVLDSQQWPLWLNFGSCCAMISLKPEECSLVCSRAVRAPFQSLHGQK